MATGRRKDSTQVTYVPLVPAMANKGSKRLWFPQKVVGYICLRSMDWSKCLGLRLEAHLDEKNVREGQKR